jgi:spore coat polysaccharide biosynthesis protein SpsF
VTLGNVGVVVAARMGSTRLPGKALLPLHGMPMILFLLQRLRRLETATLVLATTQLAADDELVMVVEQQGIPVFRGANSDLVARYAAASDYFGFDTVARVTADCPFVDAELVDWCVRRTSEFEDFDLSTTKGQFPVGLDVEICPAKQLAALNSNVDLTDVQREHLTLYFYDHRDDFVVRTISLPPGWTNSSRQFTVDTSADYEVARELASRFGRPDFPASALLTMEDIARSPD